MKNKVDTVTKQGYEIAYTVIRLMAVELKGEIERFNPRNSFFKKQLESLDISSNQIFDRLEEIRRHERED